MYWILNYSYMILSRWKIRSYIRWLRRIYFLWKRSYLRDQKKCLFMQMGNSDQGVGGINCSYWNWLKLCRKLTVRFWNILCWKISFWKDYSNFLLNFLLIICFTRLWLRFWRILFCFCFKILMTRFVKMHYHLFWMNFLDLYGKKRVSWIMMGFTKGILTSFVFFCMKITLKFSWFLNMRPGWRLIKNMFYKNFWPEMNFWWKILEDKRKVWN